jgi:hypothetical protein
VCSLRTSNDASLGLWWHYVMTSFVDTFSCICKVIHQGIQAKSTRNWRFQVIGFLEKSGPDLPHSGADFSKNGRNNFLEKSGPDLPQSGADLLFTGWRKFSSGADFNDSGADFGLLINRKEVFLTKGSRFWRSKGTKTHRKRSGAQLGEILQEKFMNYSCNLSFTLSSCLIAMCN